MRILHKAAPVVLLVVSAIAIHAQTPTNTCTATAVPTIVRAEGVAERLGDIVMDCRGVPGAEVTGNLTVFLNTVLTNRISPGNTLDINLSVDNGSGPVLANVPATVAGNTQFTFSGLRFAYGAGGQATLRISNIRGDATFNGAPLPGSNGQRPINSITAQLAFNGGQLLNFTVATFQVAVAQRGIAGTILGASVPCRVGSPLPEQIGFVQLLQASTVFASTRVSETFENAFEPRQAGADMGTRIMLRFSGYPGDARLFVPAFIAGSNATEPTSAGDFRGLISPGAYTPGSRKLYMVRVLLTDANGAGGQVAAPSLADANFNTITEVRLTNGSGSAVYEVLDADPLAFESAQIPVFLGLPRSAQDKNVDLSASVTFAPLSTAPLASEVAPIPRFRDVGPVSDCSGFGDCDSYFPKLERVFALLNFSLIQGVQTADGAIGIRNGAGGILRWTARVTYKNGSEWIRLHNLTGVDRETLRFIVMARAEMQPGVYEATITVDGGSAGTLDYPVTLRVLSVPAPVTPKPAVTEVVHGATFQAGPIVRGSLITLRGRNFGTNPRVTIDGKAARVLFANAEQINVQVPDQLSGNSVQVVVASGDVVGEAAAVNVAAVNPGIFNPGIVNQDGSVNSANNPAATGSYVQVYATGLLPPDGAGVVEAKLHDQVLTSLPYAGPAPSIPGLQQVNFQIPAGWPTMTTEVLVCSTSGGVRACSAPVKIHMRSAQ